MKKFIAILSLFFLFVTNILAQAPQVEYISIIEMLPYILPFYAITLIALGLFIHKLMRPKFPSRWLYIFSIVGILGAGVIAYQFEHFRQEKLSNDTPAPLTTFDPKSSVRLDKENQNEIIGDFWRISIPNFILLTLGLGLDYRNRKKEPEN